MRESGLFAVSVLAEGQEDVSRRFAAPGRDKLEGFDVRGGQARPAARPRGPRPRRVPRARPSTTRATTRSGWARFARCTAHPGRPLLYHAGAYRRLDGRARGAGKRRRRSVIKTGRIDDDRPREEPSTRERARKGAEGTPPSRTMAENVLMPEMSWTEVEQALKDRPIALLPVGNTEAHGPHLPVATDTVIATEMARRGGAEAEGSAGLPCPDPAPGHVPRVGARRRLPRHGQPARRDRDRARCATSASPLAKKFRAVAFVNVNQEPANLECAQEGGRGGEEGGRQRLLHRLHQEALGRPARRGVQRRRPRRRASRPR